MGFGWDDAKKRVMASPSVWDDYLKVRLTCCIYAGLLVLHLSAPLPQSHPKASPFRKKGFPLFDKIGNLIDGTRATGEFAFWAGQTLAPPN